MDGTLRARSRRGVRCGGGCGEETRVRDVDGRAGRMRWAQGETGPRLGHVWTTTPKLEWACLLSATLSANSTVRPLSTNTIVCFSSNRSLQTPRTRRVRFCTPPIPPSANRDQFLPLLQREVKRFQENYGRDSFQYGSDGWRVLVHPSADVDGPHFSPAVSSLMNQVHMNEATLSCIRARIDALSTFLIPVLRLPREVLELIFKVGSRMPQDDPILGSSIPRPFPLVVAAVSRQWREIALNTPDLWTNIVIKHPRPFGWIPLCLQRSCGQPIDITIDTRSTPLLNTTAVDQLIARFLPHIQRWRRFALTTSDPATIYAVGGRLANASAPMLRHLQLSLSGSSGNQEVLLHEILQGGADALTSVRFDSLSTPWSAPPLHNLVALDLRWLWHQTRLQYEQFRSVIAASPNIRALILRGTYIHLHAGRAYPPLHIPTLRYLELSGDTVCRMSSLLETPNLQELTLANLDETEFREFVASLPLPTDTSAAASASPSGSATGLGRYPALRNLSLLNASMCTPTRRFTRALPTITHLTVINSATSKFLQLFRKEHAGPDAHGYGYGHSHSHSEGVLSWPHLKKLTLVDDEVDYFLLHGVVRERAALGAPLDRLILNAPFIHDDQLVATLEECVNVDIVKDVDLDH
ncbi:hypothetical protein BD309DRAFT_988309 [Dichomitus squalens]|uniref:F-box domain-containing protein n=1 Tax=Dichomitus squalens TaxID=114155 RepID=A0A4Q9Q0S3_9APHY|nr:hypothetical protein BD309DRAFT_988309 [Dichomitus squalens]TBU60762.1 hypothetical protein BD310DRAFT_957387 [Dichomitus squalens]